MKKIKIWLEQNELFSRLLLIVIVCIVAVSSTTLWMAFNRAREAYITSYEDSNQLLMSKIQDDYETLNNNINQIFELVDDNQAVESYLKGNEATKGQDIIDINQQLLETSTVFADIPSNMVLLGTNGNSFFQNSNVRNQDLSDILSSELVKKINDDPSLMQYYYQDGGLTTSTSNTPGLLFIRKLTDMRMVYGYAFIFVSESYFSSIYTNLLDSSLHEVLIVDSNEQIVSSNQAKYLGTNFDLADFDSVDENLTQFPLYSYDFTLYNFLNEEHLVRNMNLIQPIILITLISGTIVGIIALFTIRRTTRPIYHLIDEIPAVNHGDFSKKVKLEGTYEIRELGKAYNRMLEELQIYFDQLLITEKEKRLSEISALQMQIQPHFIYNTLTSIKFLIWQGKNDVAIDALENFILLLRQTLSNADEFVSLEKELEGVRAYTAILKLRYGENIQSEFYPEEETLQLLVPKMIIQPIIENAYLHAFPNQQEGFIQLFTQIKEDALIIEIMDNGIGFDPEEKMTRSKGKSNYSGIGLKNINQRIQLLYTDNFGVTIQSKVGRGTSIIIRLPQNK